MLIRQRNPEKIKKNQYIPIFRDQDHGTGVSTGLVPGERHMLMGALLEALAVDSAVLQMCIRQYHNTDVHRWTCRDLQRKIHIMKVEVRYRGDI